MSVAARAEKLKVELATEHLVKTSSFPLMLIHIFLKCFLKTYSPSFLAVGH